MEILNEKQVLHVANLARLDITKEEVSKYGKQLTDILNEIEKIDSCEVMTDEIVISPTNNHDMYREDLICPSLNKKEIFKNVNHEMDGYVVVPKVLND